MATLKKCQNNLLQQKKEFTTGMQGKCALHALVINEQLLEQATGKQ